MHFSLFVVYSQEKIRPTTHTHTNTYKKRFIIISLYQYYNYERNGTEKKENKKECAARCNGNMQRKKGKWLYETMELTLSLTTPFLSPPPKTQTLIFKLNKYWVVGEQYEENGENKMRKSILFVITKKVVEVKCIQIVVVLRFFFLLSFAFFWEHKWWAHIYRMHSINLWIARATYIKAVYFFSFKVEASWIQRRS